MNRCLIAATHNQDKLGELIRILGPQGIEVISVSDPSLLANVVEDGETFSQNALIKARAIFSITGEATLADDSGLVIDALDGRPGVYSARYLGEETPYDVKIQGILEELSGVPDVRRTARFVSAVALITKNGEHIFEGVCEGMIGHAPSGNNGFGYDPVFYVGEKSFAMRSDAEKDAISHRAKALRALAGAIPRLL
ncbi:MAG: RdgB/HAM1 family non-canonical purine NTP pyrophosphatase [Oscillospiraceae bacterium]